MIDAGKINRISSERFGPLLPIDPGQNRCFPSLPEETNSAPASARLHISALSPLTQISNIDGYAGRCRRDCNVAIAAISGASATSSLPYIAESGATIEDATDIWGQDAVETRERIAARYPDKKSYIQAVGQVRENIVRFASAVQERAVRSYALSGRGGDYDNGYASLESFLTEGEAMAKFGARKAWRCPPGNRPGQVAILPPWGGFLTLPIPRRLRLTGCRPSFSNKARRSLIARRLRRCLLRFAGPWDGTTMGCQRPEGPAVT